MLKADLRAIHIALSRLLPPGNPPRTPEEVLEIGQLLSKVANAILETRPLVEKGRKILEWRIPRELAPTMNEWGSMKTWQRGKIRKALDDALLKIIIGCPDALPPMQLRRWARVTRFTVQPKQVDDANVDAIGGKMPIDTLVRRMVLVDDTPRWLRREARVEKTEKGNTHVLVELFECIEEGHDDAPLDSQAMPAHRELGEFTKHIRGE